MDEEKFELLSILDAPESPVENRNLDWNSVTETINPIPADYRKFIEIYGTGIIDDYLWVLNPFSKNQYLNFNKSSVLMEVYIEFRDMFPELDRRPPYPQNGSFFPWAITDNGDSLFWIIDNESSEWKTGIHCPKQTDEEIYDFNMSTLLCKILNREIVSDIFASDWPLDCHQFEPYKTS